MIKITAQPKNAKQILSYIKYDGINTRTAIAQKLGITKGAITTLVGALVDKGVLVEVGATHESQTKGRSRVMLSLNDDYKLSVGIVVENNTISAAICTLTGKKVAHTQHPIDPHSYHDVLSLIVDETNAILADNCVASDRIFGIGICVGDDILLMADGSNKLTRIKKDLSHALSFTLTVNLTSNALLIASKVFSETPNLEGCIGIIRFGKIISSSFMVNSQIPPCTPNRVDGFLKMQKIDDQTTYSMLAELEDDEQKEKMIETLAFDINTFATVLSPNKLYLIGDFFDEYHDSITSILDKQYKLKQKLELSFVNERSIGICGCAIATDNFFEQYDTIYYSV